MIEEITFEASDGFPLSGQLFHGAGTKPLVLISSATAVPQGFYAAFAKHLIAKGARAVLTYDYRGVAASRRARKAVPDPFQGLGHTGFPRSTPSFASCCAET